VDRARVGGDPVEAATLGGPYLNGQVWFELAQYALNGGALSGRHLPDVIRISEELQVHLYFSGFEFEK
jgi:hypothetical protein